MCQLFLNFFWLMTIADFPLLSKSASRLNSYDNNGRSHSVIFPSPKGLKLRKRDDDDAASFLDDNAQL